MKFIGQESGRVLQLFRPEEVRPSAGTYWPGVLQAIKSRYQFQTPNPDATASNQLVGVKFRSGHLMRTGVDIAIVELSVFDDGLIIVCASTDLADAVADDLSDMLVAQLNFRRPEIPRQRTYTSTVVVEFDLLVGQTLGAIAAIGDRASEALKAQYMWNHSVVNHRLAWQADPLQVPPLRGTSFAIERRAAYPYERERFWCTAPLSTPAHLAWLSEVEKLLSELSNN